MDCMRRTVRCAPHLELQPHLHGAEVIVSSCNSYEAQDSQDMNVIWMEYLIGWRNCKEPVTTEFLKTSVYFYDAASFNSLLDKQVTGRE
jgi:hypothetical protein